MLCIFLLYFYRFTSTCLCTNLSFDQVSECYCSLGEWKEVEDWHHKASIQSQQYSELGQTYTGSNVDIHKIRYIYFGLEILKEYVHVHLFIYMYICFCCILRCTSSIHVCNDAYILYLVSIHALSFLFVLIEPV